MTWREQLVIRILLLVARLVAEDSRVADEIRHLTNHVVVTAPKQELAA